MHGYTLRLDLTREHFYPTPTRRVAVHYLRDTAPEHSYPPFRSPKLKELLLKAKAHRMLRFLALPMH